MQSSGTLLGLAIAAAAVAGACRTARLETPSPAANVVMVTKPTRAWKLAEANELRGFVVLFENPARPGDSRSQHFSVRNAYQQELGTIDGLGRAWSFVPHQREARFMTTGTIAEGARAILGAAPLADLIECDLGAWSRADSRSSEFSSRAEDPPESL